MERIIAAAYKVKPEFACKKSLGYKHPSLREEFGLYDDIYNCRIARHHAEILHIFGKEIDRHTDGFYTSYGRWVNREDAAKIALACKQIDKLHYWDDRLDSSDLYDQE